MNTVHVTTLRVLASGCGRSLSYCYALPIPLAVFHRGDRCRQVVGVARGTLAQRYCPKRQHAHRLSAKRQTLQGHHGGHEPHGIDRIPTCTRMVECPGVHEGIHPVTVTIMMSIGTKRPCFYVVWYLLSHAQISDLELRCRSLALKPKCEAGRRRDHTLLSLS